MQPPVYQTGSIHGRTLSTTSHKGFEVSFPGRLDTSMDTTGHANAIHPMLRGDNSAMTPGAISLRIDLPSDSAPGHLVLEASVETDTLGIFLRRAPTPQEIHALFQAWWDIRDAAILDADVMTCREDPVEDTIAAFERVEDVIIATTHRMRKTRPDDHNSITIAGVAPFRTTMVRALPTLPSTQTAPAQGPQATALQTAVQNAIEACEADLGCIGNGYAWTVEQVAHQLLEAMAPHVPGLDPQDYKFNP